MKNSRPKSKEHGVAMVSTLIILSVLAIVAVALMQSVTTDRTSARSGADYYKAQLAADAGAAVGRAMLADLIRRYPDSVTGWQNVGGLLVYGTDNEATVLYARAQSGNPRLGASPAAFGPDVTLLAQPLVSRIGSNASSVATNLLPLADVVSSVPFVVGTSVNINATNASRTDPFVGSRSSTNPGGALVAPVTAAQWIYLTNPSGQTNARFAFWMEDESFKVNVNIATDGPRGTTSLGTNAGEARIDGAWGVSSNSEISKANFAGLAALRGNNPYPTNGNIPSPLTAMLAAGISDTKAASEVKFLTTTHSAGLDLSRGGFPRFNLNSVTNVTNGDKRTGLNRIIAAITNNNASPLFGQRFYRLANTPAGINSTSAVSTNHASIYLQKIAANIYDYLDADDQPTVISNNSSFSLVTGKPTNGIGPLGAGVDGTNSIAAMGVENVPRLQEYAIHLRVRSMKWDSTNGDSFGFVFNTNAGATNPTIATYEVILDHYFEFWNPGTRDFTASSDTFLKIFDQPAWGAPGTVTGNAGRGSGNFTTENRSSSEIPLIDSLTGEPVVFPAGDVTVLTTAPVTPAINEANAGPNAANFLVFPETSLVSLRSVPASDRFFSGTTTSIAVRTNKFVNYIYEPTAEGIGGGTNFGYNRLFEVAMQYGREGGTPSTDYASGVLIGNNQGIIESHVGLPIGNTNGTSKLSAIVESSWNRNDLSHVPGNLFHGYLDNVRGGGLKGNANDFKSTAKTKPNTVEGDPRSLLEQLEFTIWSSGNNDNQTRFWNTMGPGSGPSSTFADSTFGRPNANYVLATNWTDTSSINPGASNAPLFVRNGAMQTIGELGHITDPARPYITSGSVPTLARGGGRTLRVGQSELTNSGGTNIGWYDGKQTNESRTWTSWRLADIFTTRVRAPNTNVSLPGLLNPNGLLRDGGAAIRAALYGLTYSPTPEGAPGLAGRDLNSSRLNGVVNSFKSRLTNASAAGLPSGALVPFWERGEISELPIFNTGPIPTQMSNVFDRGREELVRRSIEMITPRGSVFTVYAIGQALQIAGNKTNVLGAVRLKQSFELTPQFPTSDSFIDNFDLSPTRISRRFAAPTSYTVRVLSSSYD